MALAKNPDPAGSTTGQDCAQSSGPRPRAAASGRSIATLLAAAACACAGAQETPLGFSIGPELLVTHDSNFYRSSGTELVAVPGSAQVVAVGVPVTGVTSESADLVGTLHEVYGRETLTASADVGRVHFQQDNQFDYTSEKLRADLASDLPYGSLFKAGFGRTAQLAHFADIGNSLRDVIDTNEVDATLAVPVLPNTQDWQAMLTGTDARTTNSSGPYQTLDLNDEEVDGGIRYQPSSGNHVDLLFRDGYGVYPNGSPSLFISPSYRDLGADLRIELALTGASHLSGRAGYLERRNDNLVLNGYLATSALERGRTRVKEGVDIDRDFSGPGFELTYVWQVTGAAALTAYGLRDLGSAGDNNYLSAVSHIYRFSPSYQPEEKIRVEMYYEWSERNYFGNYAALTQSAPGTTRLDTGRNAGLMLRWTPRRWLQFTLDLRRESRDSNILAWSYVDDTATFSALATIY